MAKSSGATQPGADRFSYPFMQSPVFHTSLATLYKKIRVMGVKRFLGAIYEKMLWMNNV